LQALAAADGRLKGPALAEAVGSTSGFVSQVVNPLVRAGWVRSEPGPSGGYSLAVALDELSVLAVIEAIEGPTDSGRCVLVDRPCNESGTCALPRPVDAGPHPTARRAGSDLGARGVARGVGGVMSALDAPTTLTTPTTGSARRPRSQSSHDRPQPDSTSTTRHRRLEGDIPCTPST
jgi:hypothetical protein